jgi:hypothetical protein
MEKIRIRVVPRSGMEKVRIRDKHPGTATLGVIYIFIAVGCVQAVAAALEHMEATASALFVGKILKEETALKLEAGTKRIQAPPCFRDYFNQCLRRSCSWIHSRSRIRSCSLNLNRSRSRSRSRRRSHNRSRSHSRSRRSRNQSAAIWLQILTILSQRRKKVLKLKKAVFKVSNKTICDI